MKLKVNLEEVLDKLSTNTATIKQVCEFCICKPGVSVW